jgi:hypothetical protein
LVLLLALLSQLVSGQNLDQRISISATNHSLGEVLNEISAKGHILFSYSTQTIPVSKKVSLKEKNEKLGVILDKLLTPMGIKYLVVENQVVLKPMTPEEQQVPVKTDSKRKYTISGYIRNKSSGEILIGANVYDQKSWQGTSTNAYGFFSLTLSEGSYQLVFSLLGYEKIEKRIELDENQRLVVEMQEAATSMNEVVIVSNPDGESIQKADPGNIRFSNSTLKQMPGFAGNIDVIKSLNAVPGINAFGDGSTFYYVRGGNNDQNLLMIDDAPIYNPSHLFGFFSALAPDAIKDVKAYKGDFPASYGGRLSSVIDVRARDGNLKRMGFAGNIGPFTSDLTFEGPIRKEKSSFILSGRRSNLNWLNFSSVANRTFSIHFYDLNAKINLRINDNNRLFITSYTGNDDFSRFTTSTVNTFGIQWKNTAGTIRWNHIFNQKLFSNTTASISRYDYYLFVSRQQNDYWTSAISNATLKTDFSWYPNPSNSIKSGIEISSHHSNPGNIHFSDPIIQGNIPEIPQYQSLEGVYYLSNEQALWKILDLNYGIRFSLWRDLGPTTFYLFDATYKVIDTASVAAKTIYKDYFNAEPRISLGCALSGSLSLRTGYSRTVQYLQMLSNSTGPFTSLEVWAPSGPNIQPQKADQYTFGIVKNFQKGITLTVETFFKKFYHQVEYKDHANMLYNPLIEGELRFGNAKSYGIELLLRKSEGRLTGWIGYSWSKVTRTVPGINNGKEYPAYYDRPNTICVNLSYRTRKRMDFSASWIYLSGAPITTPIGFYQYSGYVVPIYGAKNNDRLPAYHRLDFSASYLLSKEGSRYKQSLVLSAYNLYGRNNPFSVNFNKIMDDQGKFYVPSNIDGTYEIITTKLSVAGIIPSLNYTFRF